MAISNLRGFLNKIADDIGSEDLASLKYLCGDKLAKRRLENISTPRELFVAIGEITEGEEQQLSFLRQLFHNVGRLDLKAKVQRFLDSRKANETRTDGHYALQNNFNNTMNGRASSAVYSGTGQSSVSMYHRNEMPGQIRGSVCGSPYVSLPVEGATQQAGNRLQSDIVNVVTGVDQHAHQYTQYPMENMAPFRINPVQSYPVQSYPAQRFPVQNYPFQNYPVQNYPSFVQTCGPGEQQRPSSREEREFPPYSQTLGGNPSGQQQPTSQPDYGGNIVVEQPKPPPEVQPNPLVYQTQHSVPFGQQEQPSDKIEHCENSQDPAEFPPNNQRTTVDPGSLMTLHLGNSTISSNAQPVGVNDNDHPEQWSLTVHPNDINVGASSTSGSGKLPGNNSVQLGRKDELDSPNQGASDIHFGETNPEDHKEQGSSTMHVAENSFGSSNTSVLARLRPSSNQAQLGGKDDKGNPNQGLSSTHFVEIHPESSMGSVSDDLTVSSVAHDVGINDEDHPEQVSVRVDPTLMASTTGSSQVTRSSSSEKVPVERAVSVNYDTEVAAHLHQKCPVEMSYNCFKKYFSSKDSKLLGKGGFGKVYEGTKKFHGQTVVIKEEHQTYSGLPQGGAQLKREKKVGYIKHPNLMPLYAFCEEEGKPRCLMYPKMHTDLHKALRKHLKGDPKLPFGIRLKIALHTARGLHYLHTEVENERCVRQEIVHMDVKPGNIFLDEEFNARLGDAGMAQELPMDYSYASLSQIRGTTGYLDAFLKERHFKPVNDIFSFGIVLLELLTQKRAVENNVTLYDKLYKEGVFSDVKNLIGSAQKDVWPEGGDEKGFTEEFANLAINCVKPPEDREKLPNVCKRLEDLLDKKGVSKYSKEGAHCVSCLLNHSSKYLGVRSHGCSTVQKCDYFCATCLMQACRNPLECPYHGPAEPPIGGSDTYAVLVCGNDPDSPKTATIFQHDLIGFKSVLTDCRIVGVRKDHIFTITPNTPRGTSQSNLVKKALQDLKQKLQGKTNVFVYFYFSGHNDHNGNLLCSSENDCLMEDDLKKHLNLLSPHVREFLIILDCCFADGNIASDHLKDETYLVQKSPNPVNVEAPPHPLESLCSKLRKASGDENCCATDKSPISNTDLDIAATDFSAVDGNVIHKAPVTPSFNIRQWSSSSSQQSSYALARTGSFLTRFITCGLRGAHDCKVTNCKFCGAFKDQAKSLGYITASNLEDFFSKHVEEAAAKAGGRRQHPRIRTLHSKDTILAFYNEEPLCDEMVFKSASGYTERIVVKEFPLHLFDFQCMVFDKVKDHLPTCAEVKHLQILCDDEEIGSTSYVDLKDYLRQGYDVRCQLRPCYSIVRGPVVVEIQTYKNQVLTLLNSLQLSRNEQQDCVTFEMKTSEKSLNAEDVRECCDEDPNLNGLKESSVGKSIAVILTEASVHQGVLEIKVSDQSMDCCFTQQD